MTRPSSWFFICLTFQLFSYFYTNFCFKNFFSDMLHYHQRDHVGKMQFQTVFKFSLHHVGDNYTSQTQFNIFNFFLSPSWRLDPRNSFFFSCLDFPSSHEQPIRPRLCKYQSNILPLSHNGVFWSNYSKKSQ